MPFTTMLVAFTDLTNKQIHTYNREFGSSETIWTLLLMITRYYFINRDYNQLLTIYSVIDGVIWLSGITVLQSVTHNLFCYWWSYLIIRYYSVTIGYSRVEVNFICLHFGLVSRDLRVPAVDGYLLHPLLRHCSTHAPTCQSSTRLTLHSMEHKNKHFKLLTYNF